MANRIRWLSVLKMRAVKPMAVLLVVAAIGLLAVLEFFNFNGYCYSQRRYLSDEELIVAAIEYTLRNPTSDADIRYSSPADLRSKNPDCCFVLRQNRGPFEDLFPGTWVRALGWYVAAVEVWYRFRDVAESGYFHSFVAVGACGHTGERLGWRESTPRKSSPTR